MRLNRLHAQKKRGPVPSSLFLDQLMQFSAAAKAKHSKEQPLRLGKDKLRQCFREVSLCAIVVVVFVLYSCSCICFVCVVLVVVSYCFVKYDTVFEVTFALCHCICLCFALYALSSYVML